MAYKYKITDIFSKEIKTKNKNYMYITIPIEPYSKSNALGFGNRRAFVPKRFKEADATVMEYTKAYLDSRNMCIFEGPVLMQIDGYYSTKRVVDAPNLPKSICDALNDLAYYDDRQIILCTTTKTYDKENPRIEIFIKKVEEKHDMVNMIPLLAKAAAPKKVKVTKAKVPKVTRRKSGSKQRVKKQKTK